MALMGALNSRGRLAPLPPGTLIQGRYRIERFLRGNELHNQYIAVWDDLAGARHCWECGYEKNALNDAVCVECGSELGERHFVLSERWRGNFRAYMDLQEMGLFHQGLARVYEVFEDSSRLFTINEMVHQGFLCDMGSPLQVHDLVELISRGCETLDYLHENGIGLINLGKDQLVLRGSLLLFHDLDVEILHEGPVPTEQRRLDVERLARLLREYTPFDVPSLRQVFDAACDGQYECPAELAEQTRSSIRHVSIHDPSPGPIYAHISGMSDVGMLRTLNEDCWGWERLSDDLSLYAVADGMGGHDSGEVASEMAIKTLLASARRRLKDLQVLDDESLEMLLEKSFQEANNAIKDTSRQRRSDMGTTLVCMLIYQNRLAFVANVGDSRALLFRGSELIQISQDHSLVANLVAMGKISKAAARNHPHSNILVRTVGKEFDVEIDIFRQEVQSGDMLLLCSDGLWGEVEDLDLVKLVSKDAHDPRSTVQALVRAANENGGHDNVTALVVRVC